ncbi:protein kinase domain-containing protein [Streptomyces sp. MAR4 CNX-425]|uniref:protein kinase domain-containing protein n=1 Tax=Streptomyces sp. MAR4 CNX-425 TaxID=3406343 RepID=UPI003B509955
MAGLDSPYLTSLRGHGVTEPAGPGGRGYLVWEPLTGRPLGQLQGEPGRIGWRRALAVAEQIGAALAEVHAAGLAHGSLQPAGVLIEEAAEEVTVTVLDAGLGDFAPATDAEGNAPATGRVLYLAPEHGDGSPATPAGDLYALGAVLYEVLVGRPPYTGTVAEVVEQHRESLPLRPSRAVRGLPVEVDDVVFTLMARERADRPSSAAEAAAALAELRTSAPPSADDVPLARADAGGRQGGPPAMEPRPRLPGADRHGAPAPSAGTFRKGRGRGRRTLLVAAALLVAVGGFLTLTAYDEAEVERAVDRAARQLTSGSADGGEASPSEAAERALDDNSGWLRLRTSDARTVVSSGPEGTAVVIEVTNLLGQHPVCMRVATVVGPAFTAWYSPGRC